MTKTRLMPFVLDNSVVTGWYLPDQASNNCLQPFLVDKLQ